MIEECDRLKEKYQIRLAEPAKIKEQSDLFLENESGLAVFKTKVYG